jgi:hypothetical protein
MCIYIYIYIYMYIIIESEAPQEGRKGQVFFNTLDIYMCKYIYKHNIYMYNIYNVYIHMYIIIESKDYTTRT